MKSIITTLFLLFIGVNNSFGSSIVRCNNVIIQREEGSFEQNTSSLDFLVELNCVVSNTEQFDNNFKISFSSASSEIIPTNDLYYNNNALFFALVKNNIIYYSAYIKLGELETFANSDITVPRGEYSLYIISLYNNTPNPVVINPLFPFEGSSDLIQFKKKCLYSIGCPINFDIPNVICSNSGSIQLTGVPSGGFFSGSAGVVGNTFVPSLSPAGTNEIIYQIIYEDGSLYGGESLKCILKKNILVFYSKYINRVISATATTYSDTWPLDYTNVTAATQALRTNLDAADEVTNGTKGIWHGEESFVYVEKRNQNAPLVTVKEDGIFNNMPLFDFTSTLNGGCTPNTPKWRLVNTITEYNPSSFDIENKDILNRYSSALFGYKGDLAVAVASNAREREIGYESFEEYVPSVAVGPSCLSSGNISVYTNTAPSNTEFNKVYRPSEIVEATDNSLTVDFPFVRTANWTGKVVRVTGANMNTYNDKNTYGKYTIASVTAHATDLNKSIVTLSGFPTVGIWKGKISVPIDYSVSMPVATGVATSSIVSSKKHTGKNSLKTLGDASFEQLSLDLIPDEKYVLSAWVSADVLAYTYRMLSGTARRGFTVEFLDNTGASIGTSSIDIDDKNPVIEGWQKIEGTFQYPATSAKPERLVIHFKSPAGTSTYWDDVRLFPLNGNMQTYVYDNLTYKVSAVLDNNNYASLYYYDVQGNLFLVKKETETGIQTIQESFSHQKQ